MYTKPSDLQFAKRLAWTVLWGSVILLLSCFFSVINLLSDMTQQEITQGFSNSEEIQDYVMALGIKLFIAAPALILSAEYIGKIDSNEDESDQEDNSEEV